MSTFMRCRHRRARVQLMTHYVPRGRAPAVRLRDNDERAAFRQLIKVTGIGPNAFRGVSGLSVADSIEPSLLPGVSACLPRCPALATSRAPAGTV